MKKVLSVLLAVCLLVGALPMAASAANSGKCGENLTWNLNTSTGELVIEGTGPMDDYLKILGETIAPPWGFENPSIRKVTVKQGVTSVGDYAFEGCEKITSVTLPESVTRIGCNAFEFCFKLENVKLPKRMDSIGDTAFRATVIKSIAIPSGISTIERWTFSECKELTSVTIPNDVTCIMEDAFQFCEKLKAVNLPKGLSTIGESAFYDTGLTSISIPDSVTELGQEVFGSCEKLSSITFGKGLTKIPGSMFLNCESLSSVVLPNNIRSIELCAFNGCINLTSITIPPSVTFIEADLTPHPILGIMTAFDGCEKLTIYGKAESYAQTYAKKINIPFRAIDFPEPQKPTVAGFKDVYTDAYYADAVKWAVENNITAGTDKTHFSPNASCTRAQAVTFLWRAAGEPELQNTTTKFNDVKAGSYYEKAVQWAVENGVTAGTGETTFSPNATCTRAQIVTFLYRAENSPEITGNNSFNDVKTGAYYENAVKWAVENNITSGTGGNKFSPDNNCIRGQIVTFLYRYSK